MLPVSRVDDLPEAVVGEIPPEVPSVVTVGAAAAAADGSPSRDRLARIAAMISNAEQVMTTGSPRHGRVEDARLILLAARRNPARQRRSDALAVLAS